MDRARAERAVEELLRALGHEPAGALADTPRLVAEAWCQELLEGEALDPAAILRDGSLPVAGGDEVPPSPVVLRDLAVSTMCPHHLMPAHGRGDVIYLPGRALAGFGAVARALRAATRRLRLQEEAGSHMAEALVAGLGASGALCRLRLVHTCLASRGAREAEAVVETVSLAGSTAAPGAARDLALALLVSQPREPGRRG